MTPRRAVFVDRDGTLCVDQVHGVDVARLELRPRAAEAVRAWKRAGLVTVVVTNQSGIGRGRFTEAEMRRFHDALNAAVGGGLDAFYHCPHRPEEGCPCRKPGTLLYERAARELALDVAGSFVVGDSWRDVEAGRALGARTVLVPAPGRDDDAEARAVLGRPTRPHHVAADLLAAATWTLGQ